MAKYDSTVAHDSDESVEVEDGDDMTDDDVADDIERRVTAAAANAAAARNECFCMADACRECVCCRLS